MAEEFLDILDENGNKTGEAKSYLDTHKLGLIHRAVHVWVVNSKNELLLQKRSADRWVYSNYWDISASGHVSSGETSLEAAKKETKEELGLELLDEDFDFLFTVFEQVVLDSGKYINNEFQDVYLVRCTEENPKINCDGVEVSDIKWVSFDEFNSMLSNEKSMLVPHQEEHNILLSKLRLI